MPTSQKSFEALIGRFKAGNTLLQGWVDYAPSNSLIQKAALAAFITEVEAANLLVATTKTALDNARAARAALVFIDKDRNPTCLERRLQTIVPYLSGEFGKNHPATKFVHSVRLKMRPNYKKKAEGAPRGAGNSPMERSYAAAVGQAQEVISRLTSLGAAYKPADSNLKPPALQTLVDQIIAANTDVQNATEAYGVANHARKTLYDNASGMTSRVTSVKGYLASFTGGKKSDHYREYNKATKGT